MRNRSLSLALCMTLVLLLMPTSAFAADGIRTYTAEYDGHTDTRTETIPALPKLIDQPTDAVTQGEEPSFTSNADLDRLIEVRVDGKVIRPDADYTAVSGSTRVTLKKDFTKTLAPGVHSLDIVSTNGTVSTTFTIAAKPAAAPTSPQTGDNSHLFLWAGLMLAAAVGVAAIVVVVKKRKGKNRR